MSAPQVDLCKKLAQHLADQVAASKFSQPFAVDRKNQPTHELEMTGQTIAVVFPGPRTYGDEDRSGVLRTYEVYVALRHRFEETEDDRLDKEDEILGLAHEIEIELEMIVLDQFAWTDFEGDGAGKAPFLPDPSEQLETFTTVLALRFVDTS
ncbi:MAG: hypothetical protein KDA60_20320 [Planctomycetales bacterium]|nr:hypothetical protein [Planctomycetales bacterium]